MKQKLFSIVLTSLFALLVAVPVGAQTMMGGYWPRTGTTATQEAWSTKMNDALQSIYQTQSVTSQDKIDCSKVTDDQFETLGDTYMGVVLGTEAQHTAMEVMMGGEGSASLRQAHINMGRSYLGCWANYSGAPTAMPMMNFGGRMMGGYGVNFYNNANNGYPMMFGLGYGYPMMGFGGFGGYGIGGMLFMTIWSVLAVIGFASAIVWLVNKTRK